jgi:hypothetical protein
MKEVPYCFQEGTSFMLNGAYYFLEAFPKPTEFYLD